MNKPKLDIREFREVHLPYIQGAMWGHRALVEQGSYKGDPKILHAAFLGSLIAGRMILEFLGVGLDQSKTRLDRPHRWEIGDSVSIRMIDGDPADLDLLNSDPRKRDLLVDFIKIAHKAAGHMTVPETRRWPDFHLMIEEIDGLLERQLQTLRPT